VMLRLVATGLPRQRAYEMVQRSALAAHAGQGAFRDLLAADPEVAGRLSAPEIADAFDLDHALRHVAAIYARALGEEDKA
jgi:adenylosuccinate lyase